MTRLSNQPLIPDVGIGVTFFSGLETLLDSQKDLINVIEIEPQTHWFTDEYDNEKYIVDEKTMKKIKSYNYTKIIHGVANPIGGTLPVDKLQTPLLIKMINEFKSPWISEHLSFNKVEGKNGIFSTAFFLPPRQTIKGVEYAIQNIRSLADDFPIPFAIENGVNYLKQRNDELDDGEFISNIIEGSKCGLILDLHNAWTNERNGRQPVDKFLDQIPLDQVWEIHLAGGEEEGEYWLDAHSGAIPQSLVDLTKHVLPRLKNLHAIIFEITPSYLPSAGGLDTIRSQIKVLHNLWDIVEKTRKSISTNSNTIKNLNIGKQFVSTNPSPKEWETALASLVIGFKNKDEITDEISLDPGIGVYHKLIFSNRAYMIVSSFELTSRLLILTLGQSILRNTIFDFCKKFTPEQFGLDEGRKFIKYIMSLNLNIEYLNQIITFEKLMHCTIVKNNTSQIEFDFDILYILSSLMANKKPHDVPKGHFLYKVTPDIIERIYT